MFLDQVNLNQLRVFECVYRTRSMTTAARELHLTQSGVSQHMKALEGMLGIRLFDRIRQRLVPTSQSSELYQQCSSMLHALEESLQNIKAGDRTLMGTVSIGMPIEFGNHAVLPLLSDFGVKHPRVRFHINLGFASTMNDLLLQGELDFAFVDEFTMDRRILTETVCDETLELCISQASLQNLPPAPRQDRKFFETLEYVEYEKEEPLLRMWFKHHLQHRNLHLNVRAYIMDVQGISRMILNGLGAGIIPGYLLQSLQKNGHKLHRFKGCGKPLKNLISVAHLRERTQSPAAAAVLQHLKNSFRTPGRSAA